MDVGDLTDSEGRGHGRPWAQDRQTNGGDELLARIGNYEICKAAFEKAIFIYPNDHLEMRQGARVILKSKER
jgi:hypothetical protein